MTNLSFVATMLLFSVAGCTGDVSSGRASTTDSNGGSDGDFGGHGGDGGTSTTNSCDNATSPVAPLVRLTNLQYANTLRDLFRGMALPDLSLPREVALTGFINNAKAQTPSPDLVESYSASATVVAKAASSARALHECATKVPVDEARCGLTFIKDFGRRSFRRPLSDTEIAEYQSLLSKWTAAYGFSDALSMVAESFLQSPDFLYRIERGEIASDGKRRLTSPERATRLAYFLTNSMPDTELAAAADKDELVEADKLQAQARRLLELPAARAMVADFNSQWLKLDKLNGLQKDKSTFTSFNDEVAASLKNGTIGYIDRLFWQTDGSLIDLLMDTHAMVDKNLAAIYGVPAPQGNAMAFVPVNGDQRAGVLTQAGLLAAFSHSMTSAPVQRGVLVLDRFLCQSPPPPPPEVDTSLPAIGANERLTTRQQIERTHNKPTCAGCHSTIDAVGFAYENFDAIGAYRTMDNGSLVDASATLTGLSIEGKVTGAKELAKKLSTDPEVSACVAGQWFQYARGLNANDFEPCTLSGVTNAFRKAQLSMKDLLVAIAVSDAFLAPPSIQ